MTQGDRDGGISPIIAEILMIFLVILVFGIVIVIFSDEVPVPEKVPVVAAKIEKDSTKIVIEHLGGDELPSDDYYVSVDGEIIPKDSITLQDGSYPWSPGENLYINHSDTGSVRDVVLVFDGDKSPVILARKHYDYVSAGDSNTTQDDYVRYPGFTAEAWIKWNVNPNPGGDSSRKWATIVVDGNTDRNRRYQLQHNSDNSKFEFAVATESGDRSGVPLFSSTSPVTGEWYYLTGVYNRTDGKVFLYVNGNPDSSRSYDTSGLRDSPNMYQVGGPSGILWHSSTGQRKFNGEISGLNTYGEAFSPEEIKARYDAGRG
ncbi:LamG-like jellyroll fold domain-containing protein [Methanoplanus limicola]|uniref:Archaeal Type IV pilin N-terminal domain-containing protein n=1 Tax=Methanoplanus limicola DSM 2279 TaxID=937775 RepID=H1Z0X3_9EURY|nr:LamG-like jellyroll fold domain-containing protein [Methanoplanus limicola]EHQ36266.1 hypothetical protein Metlim_2203 [Methanoplanus limicola DSM 2279]